MRLSAFTAVNPGSTAGQGTKTRKVNGHDRKGGMDLDIDTHAGGMLCRHGDGLLKRKNPITDPSQVALRKNQPLIFDPRFQG